MGLQNFPVVLLIKLNWPSESVMGWTKVSPVLDGVILLLKSQVCSLGVLLDIAVITLENQMAAVPHTSTLASASTVSFAVQSDLASHSDPGLSYI